MTGHLVYFLLLSAYSIWPVAASDSEILNQLFTSSHYDPLVRPPRANLSVAEGEVNENGGNVVTTNVYLRSIRRVDETNMDITVQITLRHEWMDKRLAYQDLAQEGSRPRFLTFTGGAKRDEIWTPDTFFQNELQAHKHVVDKPNMLIRIHPDGRVLYSERLTLVLDCPMSLRSYPMDRQKCTIDFASYAYTTDDIEFQWKQINPLQQKATLYIIGFDNWDLNTSYCTAKTLTGEYSCLRISISLHRLIGHHIKLLFVPTTMLVIASWAVFWLGHDTPGVVTRSAVGIAALITVWALVAWAESAAPRTSYLKAMDIWCCVCVIFVFSALLETALAVALAKRHASTAPTSYDIAEITPLNELLRPDSADSSGNKTDRRLAAGGNKAKRVDNLAKVIFPVGFCLFIACFWAIYAY